VSVASEYARKSQMIPRRNTPNSSWLNRKTLFVVVYGFILLVTTLAGIEFLASFLVPNWPARALRSVEVSASPQLGINSWGMRDRERAISRASGIEARVVVVGDSFVENYASRLSLPAAIEQYFLAEGKTAPEVVNLGVSGTGPPSYYFRLKEVGLAMTPDAIILIFYSGNDFVSSQDSYSSWSFPPLIDESPGRALLGAIMPRTNWLLVNRLRLSEFLHLNGIVENEADVLSRAIHLPPQQRLDSLTRHIKTFYYPNIPEARIAEVIGRAGPAFWRQFEEREVDREYLHGWMLNLLIGWETNDDRDIARSPEDAPRLVSRGEIDATASWLRAMNDAARSHRVPLIVALAPSAIVDPAYVEFWAPWPRFFSWNYLGDERHRQLAAAPGGTDIHLVDLRLVLDGVSNTYRKLDGHWTEKGVAIVAERLGRELDILLHRK
jgi:hypothetical protein